MIMQMADNAGATDEHRALNYLALRYPDLSAENIQEIPGSTSGTCSQFESAACDIRGRPIDQSNFGNSIGRRGLSAPGDDITSLGAEEGKLITLGGTSAAAPFITGTIALLQSEFPAATSAEVKFAVTQAYGSKRTTIVPPLLDAWASYEFMTNIRPF